MLPSPSGEALDLPFPGEGPPSPVWKAWMTSRPSFTASFLFEFQWHRIFGEAFCSALMTVQDLGIALEALLARVTGSHTYEAPRRETPCQVESGTVVSPNATRPCQEKRHRPLRGVARPRQPRHRERCHACSCA